MIYKKLIIIYRIQMALTKGSRIKMVFDFNKLLTVKALNLQMFVSL